jgi:hypothetical protein
LRVRGEDAAPATPDGRCFVKRWIEDLVAAFCGWLVGSRFFRGRVRVIYDRQGRLPYLTRAYLFGMPRHRDSGYPFDPEGRPRDGISWRGRWGLYLHQFHKSDDPDLHSHPWVWALSWILSGGYVEERLDDADLRHGRTMPSIRRFRAGSFNLIRKTDYHRVELVGGRPCWTLFLVGPKFSSWGFWVRATGKFVPWRQYTDERRQP